MDIQLPQIIFQMINFLVVMGALTYLLYKPVQKVLDERANRVQEGQKAAQEAIEAKDKAAELEEKITTRAEKKAAQILEEARVKSTQLKQEAVASARKAAQEELDKMQTSWQAEKAGLVADLKAEMIEAVITVTEKVTAQKLTAKADEALISEELESLLKKI